MPYSGLIFGHEKYQLGSGTGDDGKVRHGGDKDFTAFKETHEEALQLFHPSGFLVP